MLNMTLNKLTHIHQDESRIIARCCYVVKQRLYDLIIQAVGCILLTHCGRDKTTVIADGIFASIFVNENVKSFIQISAQFVPETLQGSIPAMS